MWVAWYQTLAILWAWKKEESLLGRCSSPSLFLKEVSEALPWSAFGRVDHQVLPWNCVSCYHLKDLKVFICFVCSLLKGNSRSVPPAASDRMCCEQWRCFWWCWEQPNKGCGTGIQVPPRQICYRHWLYWTVKCVCRAEPWDIEVGIKETAQFRKINSPQDECILSAVLKDATSVIAHDPVRGKETLRILRSFNHKFRLIPILQTASYPLNNFPLNQKCWKLNIP